MGFRSAHHHWLTRLFAIAFSVLVCASALDFGHAGGDDRDFGPPFVVHDHNAHRFSPSAPTKETSDGHCFICHTLRLLHFALTAKSGCIDTVAYVRPYVPTNRIFVQRVASAALAPRAPPVQS